MSIASSILVSEQSEVKEDRVIFDTIDGKEFADEIADSHEEYEVREAVA